MPPLSRHCLLPLQIQTWWAPALDVLEASGRAKLKYAQGCQRTQVSRVRLFATPWTAALQASLSITNSWNLLKFMSIESVMPSSHLILCHPLLLPSIFPSIRVFSNESALHIRWPKYWSFRFSISRSNEHPGLISFRMDWLDLLAVQGSLKSLQHYSAKAFPFEDPGKSSETHTENAPLSHFPFPFWFRGNLSSVLHPLRNTLTRQQTGSRAFLRGCLQLSLSPASKYFSDSVCFAVFST